MSTAKLPLLIETPRRWAELAADNLPVFLADHALCEQQAALFGLNLVAHYPEDDELVIKMTSLAAEEVVHLRRVARLLHERGLKLSRRRANSYVRGLHERLCRGHKAEVKIDRLLVGALIEARSCERFTRLQEVLGDRDPEVARLMADLGPAESRHWEMFYGLAAREIDAADLDLRWQRWLSLERDLISGRGTAPTVHG